MMRFYQDIITLFAYKSCQYQRIFSAWQKLDSDLALSRIIVLWFFHWQTLRPPSILSNVFVLRLGYNQKSLRESDDEVDASFWLKGFGLGLTIAAPVGPIGVLVIRRTLADGRLVGLVSGLGAATADLTYGAVAGFG